MSIATDGYGEGQTLVTWGYGLIGELILKAKFLFELLKRTISISLSKMYDVDLEVTQKAVEVVSSKMNIDLQMTKRNIDIELEVVK